MEFSLIFKSTAALRTTLETRLAHAEMRIQQQGSQIVNYQLMAAENERLKLQLSSARRRSVGITKRGSSYGHRMGFASYSKSQLRRRRINYIKQCRTVLAALDFSEFSVSSIRIKNNKTGQLSDCNISDSPPIEPTAEILTKEDMINAYVLLKDDSLMSYANYHELSQIDKNMPRSYQIRKRAKELNSQIEVMELNGVPGVRFSYRNLLERRIRLLRTADSIALRNNPIEIRIAADGTNFGRMPAIVLEFEIIGDDLASKPLQQIALAKVPENHENMKLAFCESIKEIKMHSSITVDNVTYNIMHYLTGDWKFLNCAGGIQACSSMYFCLWCYCTNGERHATAKEWSITDPSRGLIME